VWNFFHGYGQTQRRLEKPAVVEPILLGEPRWALKQYWLNALGWRLWAPLKGRRWMARFQKAAFLRGLIDEARAHPVS
jgi:hypothetical protein